LFLLSDVLLITSYQNESSGIFSFQSSLQKHCIHQVIDLNEISFNVGNSLSNDLSCTLDIITKERIYKFITENESDKWIWLEELEGAILNLNSQTSRSPLWFYKTFRGSLSSAIILGDMDLVRKHISNLDRSEMDTPDDSGMTPLHWAAFIGNFVAVKEIVEAGSSIDCCNRGLNTALLIAASCCHKDLVHYFILNGADITIRNLKDHNALDMALLYGRSNSLVDIVQELCYNGININHQNSSGQTPLHECAGRNLSIAIQILVDNGADVNIKSKDGCTALISAYQGYIEMEEENDKEERNRVYESPMKTSKNKYKKLDINDTKYVTGITIIKNIIFNI
jgi:hypothetical protein